MRFFLAHKAGVGDGAEAIADAAAVEDGVDFAVGVGDHREGVLGADALKGFASSGEDLIPVGRELRVADQFVAQAIAGRVGILKKICVESPPKAVIDKTALHSTVEFRFCFALERLPLRKSWMEFRGQGCEDSLPVRK